MYALIRSLELYGCTANTWLIQDQSLSFCVLVRVGKALHVVQCLGKHCNSMGFFFHHQSDIQ